MNTQTPRSSITVTHVSSAHQHSDNRIHLREAATLHSAGYRVHLVAIQASVPVPDSGVTLHLLPTRQRFSRLLLGSLEAITCAIRTRADLYHLHDPELIWAIPLLRALGKRVIYDAHEDLPAQILDKHYIPHRLRKGISILAQTALLTTRLAHAVVPATENIAAKFPNASSVIHNYPKHIHRGAITPIADREFDVVYIGAMSEERGTLQLIRALGLASIPDGTRVVMAGTPTPADLFKEVANEPAWNRIAFLNQIGPLEARQVVNSAKVGIVTLLPNRAQRDSLPTKIFEYFAEGVPVVLSDFPLWRSIIDRYECGILVNPRDPAAIAEAIATYLNDQDLLRQHSLNASNAFRTALNWEAEEVKLLSLYDHLMGTTGPRSESC